MDNKYVFAKNLKHYMDANGKTRRDLCADLGFNYYTVSDWINGKKYPRMDKVDDLADYFGISKSDLIEEKPTAADDGLSEKQRKLIDFAKSVPEEKADVILQVMKTIVAAE